MEILDIKNNIKYDLSSVGGVFGDVTFEKTSMQSLSEWPETALTPSHKGNYLTWETATVKVKISASTRATLEKRISWYKAMLIYSDLYFTEKGFDFHFKGELASFDVSYGGSFAYVTAELKGRKISVAQVVSYTFTTSQSGTARVNYAGNCRVPLRIDMTVNANGYTPGGLQLTARNANGATLWSENIQLKQWHAQGANWVVTIDGEKGVMYATNTATNVRENWVENYNAKFLPYIEPSGTVLTLNILGVLGGQPVGVSKIDLTFEGRWV